MKALIVYDSWYDNTHQIAEAIADEINGDVHVVKVDGDPYKYLNDCELLIVGSPTHGGVATPPINEFLDSLMKYDCQDKALAAFDTRVRGKWLKIIGFAANHIAKRLEQTGGTLSAQPEGFYVKGKEGPLLEGELGRARQWARVLANHMEKSVLA